MNQNPVYQYVEEEDEGLTFRQIGHFIKKTFPITLITMLCCIIVFTAIYAIVLMKSKGDSAYVATQLTFSDKNMSLGQDPNGQQFDSRRLINTYYVQEALKTSGLETLDTTDVVNRLSVTPVVDAHVVALIKGQSTASISGSTVIIDGVTYYPTRYQINFAYSKLETATMSRMQASTFLNNLVVSYRDNYVEDTAVYTKLLLAYGNVGATQEFIDYVTNAEVKNGEIAAFLSQLSTLFPSANSPANNLTTPDMLLAQLRTKQIILNEIINSILTRKIARDSTTVETTYGFTISAYEARAKALEGDGANNGLIKSMEEQILTFKLPTVSIVDKNGDILVQQIESQPYNDLNAQLVSYKAELATLKEAISNATTRKTAFAGSTPTDSDVILAMETAINAYAADMNQLVKLVNNVAQDLKTVEVENNVTQSMTAAEFSNNPTVTQILMTYLVAIIVSFVLGLIAHAIYRSVLRNKGLKKATVSATAQPSDEILERAQDDANTQETTVDSSEETESTKAVKQPPKKK